MSCDVFQIDPSLHMAQVTYSSFASNAELLSILQAIGVSGRRIAKEIYRKGISWGLSTRCMKCRAPQPRHHNDPSIWGVHRGFHFEKRPEIATKMQHGSHKGQMKLPLFLLDRDYDHRSYVCDSVRVATNTVLLMLFNCQHYHECWMKPSTSATANLELFPQQVQQPLLQQSLVLLQ